MHRVSLSPAGCAVGFLLLVTGCTLGQTLKLRPPAGQAPEPVKNNEEAAAPVILPLTLPMTVPSGTPIKVALES